MDFLNSFFYINLNVSSVACLADSAPFTRICYGQHNKANYVNCSSVQVDDAKAPIIQPHTSRKYEINDAIQSSSSFYPPLCKKRIIFIHFYKCENHDDEKNS